MPGCVRWSKCYIKVIEPIIIPLTVGCNKHLVHATFRKYYYILGRVSTSFDLERSNLTNNTISSQTDGKKVKGDYGKI